MSNIVSNKTYRELLETRNVFADPAYCREAWKSVGTAILLSPAIGCIGDIDTREGAIESYTYDKLCRELKEIDGKGKGRQPTELEMIFHCQAAKARFDTSAAVFVRDTVGAKPIDESRVQVSRSQYEEMSDDELEALLRYRQSKTYEAESVPTEEHTAEAASSTDTPTATIADTEGTTTANIASESSVDASSCTIADSHTATIAPIADAADTAPSSTIAEASTAPIADSEEQA